MDLCCGESVTLFLSQPQLKFMKNKSSSSFLSASFSHLHACLGREKWQHLGKFSEDMMRNILSRLPPETLMRFRCVLKSWHELINKPSFVDLHLSTSMHNKVTSSTYVLLKHNVLTDPSIKDEKEAVRDTLFNPDNDQRDILLSSLNLVSLVDKCNIT